jgi:hypothetical protein
MDHFNKVEGHLNEVFHRQLIYTVLVIFALTFVLYSSVTYVIKRDLAGIKDIESTQMTYMKERGHTKLEDFMAKNTEEDNYAPPSMSSAEDAENLVNRRPALEAGL